MKMCLRGFHLSLFLLICLHYAQTENSESFDYIIVGAGSAGATLASRLSEMHIVTVLLLEAGTHPSFKSEIPLLAMDLQKTAEDWNYTTETQQFGCQGFIDKKCYYPRGRALGGSSILNYMLYVRGNKKDFDNWAENGATGWSYEDVLPYFKKSEDITTDNNVDMDFHGRKGELTVSPAGYHTKLRDAYLEAIEQLGFPVTDINGKTQTGFAPIQTLTRSGFRCSTEKAFLRPAYHRKNLKVVTDALVTKVEINNNNEVQGVHYYVNGVAKYAGAKREVILSAGSINTPQILMLSGIGPKEHLQELGIDVIADLPVGQNLQDHVMCAGVHFTINTTDAFVLSRVLKENMTPGTGPLTSVGGVEVVGFFKTKYEMDRGDFPDVELIISSTSFGFPTFNKQISKFYNTYKDRDVFSIMPMVLRPSSIGHVKLTSKNPTDPPIIYIPYLKEIIDKRRLVEGLKMAKIIGESEPLRRFGAKLISEPIPGCEGFDMSTDRYLECVAEMLSTTVYHPIGTCKMGDPKKEDTVVDLKLRVKTIYGLRVVDASVMPSMISGHTHAAAVMIGEKAADIIKESFKANQWWYKYLF